MSLTAKAELKRGEFDKLDSNMEMLEYMHQIINDLYCQESTELKKKYSEFLLSCGFKKSSFYEKAVKEFSEKAFKSDEAKYIIKYLMDNYIAVTDEQKKFYEGRLECLLFSGSTANWNSPAVECNSNVATLIVRDNLTSKIFELGVPIVDNCIIKTGSEASDGVGKIRIWNLTPKISDQIDIKQFDIFRNGTHLVIGLTYDAEECAQIIYDFLTTDKYDCVDIRKPYAFMSYEKNGKFEFQTYEENIYSYNNDRLYTSYEDVPKKPEIPQEEIDLFIKKCTSFLEERIDIRNKGQK